MIAKFATKAICTKVTFDTKTKATNSELTLNTPIPAGTSSFKSFVLPVELKVSKEYSFQVIEEEEPQPDPERVFRDDE